MEEKAMSLTRYRVLMVVALMPFAGCSSSSTTQSNVNLKVAEMIAVKDVPAGTIIPNDHLQLFGPGDNLYDIGKHPKEFFSYNWIGLIDGKMVARDLKKGERVGRSDIVEPDGSPFQVPKGALASIGE
jgi:hypothetical protein